MAVKLKPCPFCGSAAVHITDAWPHYPYCLDCGAAIRGGPYPTGDDGIRQAAERWNQRAGDTGTMLDV
ncbi:MAG: Lar family restriction alleviation protein [Oscillospiraceae bacterium]|nr:Lar family restriction alleviation protein [Oscillospiraceae bacterium]